LRSHNIPILPLTVILLLFAAAGCDSPRSTSDRAVVVTSIAPLGDWVRAIGGDAVRVEVLVPRNASPHTFELRPRQLRDAGSAALFVFMGAGLEFWAENLIANASPDATVLRLSDGAELLQTGEDHAHDHGDGHSHAEGNPHLWLDPVFADDAAARITDALVRVLPGQEDALRARAAAWTDSLLALDAHIRAVSAGWSHRRFVEDHSSWVYFAARYDLEQAGVIEATPGREISARDLGALITHMRAMNVRAVFADARKSSRAADVLAEATGAAVARLDPIGSEVTALRYLELMRYNVREMTRVLR
jgi:ABC-type Zn uptake system ZnuABC Zn-binding protein ZnuA